VAAAAWDPSASALGGRPSWLAIVRSVGRRDPQLLDGRDRNPRARLLCWSFAATAATRGAVYHSDKPWVVIHEAAADSCSRAPGSVPRTEPRLLPAPLGCSRRTPAQRKRGSGRTRGTRGGAPRERGAIVIDVGSRLSPCAICWQLTWLTWQRTHLLPLVAAEGAALVRPARPSPAVAAVAKLLRLEHPREVWRPGTLSSPSTTATHVQRTTLLCSAQF